MWNWLRKLERAAPPSALRGSPVKPRLKTYSAATGYVFQYVYRGHRSAPRETGEPATEYVFSVTRDRKTFFPVSVWMAEVVVMQWSELHHRELSAAEMYAIAKLSLFEAFDERETVGQSNTQIEADREAIGRHLQALGRL